MPALVDYRTDLDWLLGTAVDTSTWTTLIHNDGLRHALSDLNDQLVYESTFTVTTAGYEQDLSGITALHKILGVAYPWTDGDDFADPAFTQRWTLIEPNKVYFPHVKPAVGEKIRVRYTKLHTIQSLDTGSVTTVPENLRRLLVRGAAGYELQTRIRQLSENPAEPKEAIATLQRLSDDFLQSFTQGITRANGRRIVAWSDLGL